MLHGIIVTYLVKVSTITNIQSLPESVVGKVVIKSKEIISKGFFGTNYGYNKP